MFVLNLCRYSAVLFTLVFVSAASSQIVTTTPVTPELRAMSPGSVDMRTGEYTPELTDLTIGANEYGGLSFIRVPEKFKAFTSNWRYGVFKRPASSGGNYYQFEN